MQIITCPYHTSTSFPGNRKESPGKEVEVVWDYGHGMRTEEHYVGRRAIEMRVQGRGRDEGLREDGWTE